QCKLAVGAPIEPFEREADRAAAAAPSGGSVRVSSTMPSSPSGTTSGSQASLTERISSAGGGRPLSDALRNDMEPAFGADFSNVRIHDTSQDRADAENLGARAFTHKNDIWLGPGSSADDRGLM